MQRLRELLAHGGIALPALVFALGLALFELARQVAQEIVSAVIQQLDTPEGDDPLGFTIGQTEVHYGTVLLYAIALTFLVAALYAGWRLARGATRTCTECLSAIPLEIAYGGILSALLALGIVALAGVVVVRRRNRELGLCPFCSSRIPYVSTHCAYCGSGVAPAEP